MRALIVFPLVLDNWQTFEPFTRRFCKTFREHRPLYDDHKVIVAVNGGRICDDIAIMFYGINTTFVEYHGNGCDIGSAQFVSTLCQQPDDFLINMTSRCHFHREGWLARFMEVRSKYGPGLYGASASHEGGTPHICTRAYALDASLFRDYPHLIDTRSKGQKFECGEWCLTSWIKSRKLPTVQVLWDSCQDEAHWRDPKEQGIYRRNNQSAMLVWDRHTDIYRDASAEERIRLENMADGVT